MARYTAEVAYIASIYPGQLEPQRRNYGPSLASAGKAAVRSSLFQLEPVKRGEKPFVLTISDCFEDILDLGQLGVGGNNKARTAKPVPVESIVLDDLIARWTGGLFGVPQDAKPGVMKINNTMATKDEMREMMEMQTRYFEYMFSEGERIYKDKPAGESVTATMRIAAEWLMRPRLWSNTSMAAASAPCPFCREMRLDPEAYICAKCTRVVRAIPPELAVLNQPAPVAPGSR